jgi:tRNA-Thr(GGU) m(6)t(6)A37 methyltransferase TsaA
MTSANAADGVVATEVPRLAGVHHLKLPVSDLERSRAWYESRLGYELETEFVEQGTLMGVGLRHPGGGPGLALRLNPERAAAAAGFDYFAIGVPDRAAIEALAARLTAFGEDHAGVHQATLGWILPLVHDPDGHEVRFYTHEHHTEHDGVRTVHDPRETVERADGMSLRAIGRVESPLVDRAAAPRQGDEGAPDAWLVFDAEFADGVRDLAPGTSVLVLTWLDRADRGVLVTRPRDDPARPVTGVFATRSPDRPNPIGLHLVELAEIDGLRVRVRNLEALDGTPVVDVKPVLGRER